MLTCTAPSNLSALTVADLPIGTLFTTTVHWPLYLKTDDGCFEVGTPRGKEGEGTSTPGRSATFGFTTRVRQTFGLLHIADDGCG